MLVLLFLSTFLLSFKAAELPLLAPFNLNASAAGYLIQGKLCVNFLGACIPTLMVVDSPNNRLVFQSQYEPAEFVTRVFTSTGNYYFGQDGLPPCTKMPGTYATEVAANSQALSKDGSRNPGLATYFGSVKQAAGCAHDLSLFVETQNDIITYYSQAGGQPLPFGPNGTVVCVNVDLYFLYDISTLRRGVNFDSYFVLPASCSTPADYCQAVFPPGNPCVTLQKK
jgi:hypothetical protein